MLFERRLELVVEKETGRRRGVTTSGAYIKWKRETLGTAIKDGSTIDIELVQIQALSTSGKWPKCKRCHEDLTAGELSAIQGKEGYRPSDTKSGRSLLHRLRKKLVEVCTRRSSSRVES